MIASIQGKITQIFEDGIVIEVGGVGVLVHIPLPLRDRLRRGETLALHTHLIVREDLLALYGFEQIEERQFFLLLLGVTGIGPKLALTILSTLTPDAIRRAVFNEQPEVFTRVPGLGRKTAQKVLLHLQDRLKPSLEDLHPTASLTDADTEVLAALTALGYSVVEAQAAIQRIPRDAPTTVEDRLRLALQSL
ncbi:MAG: Holliday junction branch migration protein RuvA [Anaerolineales bacterium]